MYGIWSIRSAQSRLGPAEGWLKRDGRRVEFHTREEAEVEAARIKAEISSPNLNYLPKEIT